MADKRGMIPFLIGVICLTFLPCQTRALCLGGQEGQNLDNQISHEMEIHKIPSIAAGIIKNEAIVWKKAYGQADRENGVPATTETIYLLASISKLVVVTGVMQLYEQGVIDIDEDISLYLPFVLRSLHFPANKITARMLMTHTSGLAGPQTDEELPGFYDWFPVDSAPSLSETLNDYLLPGGRHYTPAVWTRSVPGQQELYSNLGATLLGYLVEFASGQDFQAYCQNHIFLPLEMLDTSYKWNDLNPKKVASLYVENYVPIDHYSRRDFPAGQMKSSVEDFSHFLMAYINGGIYRGKRILEEKTVEEILRIHNYASGTCLAWKSTLGGWYGHSGGVTGASTYVEYQKKDKVGLIIFSNVFLGEGSTLHPPFGNVYGLIRKEANKFRDARSTRTRGVARTEAIRSIK